MKIQRLTELGLLVASLIVGFLLCEALFRAYLFYADYRAEGDRSLTILDIGSEQYNLLVKKGLINESSNLFIASDDPDIRYVLNPRIDEGNGSVYFKITRDGFRDNEYSIRKKNKVFRMMILGDSLAIGYKLNASDRYSEYLEEMLNNNPRAKTGYEVINAAVPGYDIRQEVEMLREKGLKYNPDLVIVSYSFNDPAIETGDMRFFEITRYCNNNFFQIDYEKAGSTLRYYRRCEWMLNKSMLLSHLIQKYMLEEAMLEEYESEMIKTYGSMFAKQRPDFKWDETYFRIAVCLHYNNRFWTPAANEFKKLGNLSRLHDFNVLLLIQPKADRADVLWEHYPLMPIHRKIIKEAESNGFHAHDPINDFKKFPSNLVLREDFRDPVHPSPLGHRVAAVSLYNYLIENKLIPEHNKFSKKPITDALNITLMKST
jgi:lysophospholipase L1-like esterase